MRWCDGVTFDGGVHCEAAAAARAATTATAGSGALSDEARRDLSDARWSRRTTAAARAFAKPHRRRRGAAVSTAAAPAVAAPSQPQPLPPATAAPATAAAAATAVNETLVVLLGSARGGEASWASLYRHVLDALRADLALAFGSASRHVATSLVLRARYVWVFDEPADWGDVLDAVAVEANVSVAAWRQAAAHPRTVGSGLYGGARIGGRVLAGSGAIIFGLRWLLLRHHHATLESYRRIVLTRSDHLYVCDHANVWPRLVLRASASQLPPVGVVEGRRSEYFGGLTDR